MHAQARERRARRPQDCGWFACRRPADFVRARRLSVVLATMHSDVRGWLRPDWTLAFDGQPRCLRYEGEPGPPAELPTQRELDYFQHETLTITLKGLP